MPPSDAPELVHVDKPASDPDRALYFWRHRTRDGVVQLSNVPTNLTPNRCSGHGFAFDSVTCPACSSEEPGTHVSGHESGVLLLHVVCDDCGELSDGYPRDETHTVAQQATLVFAMSHGWRMRLAGVFRYVCAKCVQNEGNPNMAKKKTNGAEQNGQSAKPKMRQLEITVPLDAAQMQVRRAKLVDLEVEIDKLKEKKREAGAKIGAQIKEKNEERAELLEQLTNQVKKLTAKVEERPNDRLAQYDIVRVDTGDLVDTRPMTAEERSLDIEDVIKAKQNAAADEKKKKRGKRAAKSKPAAATDSGIVEDDYQPDGASA